MTAGSMAHRNAACAGADCAPKISCLALMGIAIGMATVMAATGVNVAYAADVARGAQLYAIHCTSCHGRTGVSVMPGAPNFARSEKLLQPDIQLLASIKAGRNAMPGYIGILQDREILDVIAYLRTLRQ
jgi:cytochrome c6